MVAPSTSLVPPAWGDGPIEPDRRGWYLLALMLVRALVLLYFVASLVTQTPHLVHHLFEHDAAAADDCAFAAAAERHHAAPTPVVALPSALDLVSVVTPKTDARQTARPPRPAGARAPPSAA
jgi:hypothetical protein